MTVEEDRTPDPSSSLLAFFGSELHRLRSKARLSQTEVAKLAHTTQSMVSKLEFAKRVPSEDLARDLDIALGTDGHFGRLHPLVIRYAYPSWFLPYVEFEQEASQIRSFESQVIPGLLQTEDYAREVLRALRPDNLEELVAARVSRQDILDGDSAPRLWLIVDEYALFRTIGGAAVMGPQLQRLLEAGERPRIVIQVIPRTVVAHPGLAGPFTLFGFDEGTDVLYVDCFGQGRAAPDGNEVAEAVHAYDLLRASALSPEASADLIGKHMKGLEP